MMSTAFLLLSGVVCTSNLPAQACGRDFAAFKILDSEGRSIPDVTIELIAEAPDEQYGRFSEKMRDETRVKISPLDSPILRVTAQETEDILKQNLPMSMTKDFCENPLKQLANATKVRHPHFREEASTKYFGFCTREGYERPFLLQLSAPGYVTDYYVGYFLGNCRRTYAIVLTRKE